MKRFAMLLSAAGCVILWNGSALRAELTEGQKQAAEALIRQFSAREFEARQQAVDRLIDLGTDVVPLIKKTMKETADNEVRTRCEMVLAGIEKKYGVEIIRDDAAAKTAVVKPMDAKSLEASRVTIDVAAQPLSKVVEMLAEQSGNERLAVPEALIDKPVTMSVKDMPYWQAVDEMCRSAGVLYQLQWSQREQYLGLAEMELALVPNAYAGPAVLTMDAATNSMRLRKAKAAAMRGMGGTWTGEGLRYSISCYWEDRLPVLETEVEFTRALAPDGKDLLAAAEDDARAMQMRWSGMGATGGTRSYTSTSLTINQLPEGLLKLKEVSGIVRMQFGTGEKELSLKDVDPDMVDKSVTADGLTLTVKKANNQRGRGNYMVLTLRLDKGDKPVEDVANYRTGPYGFFLVDNAGKRNRGYAGLLRQRRQGGAAGQVIIGQGGAQLAEGEFNVGFYQLPEGQNNWTLVYVYPAAQETKEYPFTFKEVPVP